MVPCAAGRDLIRRQDPEWSKPCDQLADSMLHLPASPEHGSPPMFLILCQHHMDLLNSQGLLSNG